ncbi:MAG: hypothetical protein HAW58_04910, partial [Candidatus Thioglobus sp.]|nr:hypothetical protein [Candidatus Thioglobus sp.]
MKITINSKEKLACEYVLGVLSPGQIRQIGRLKNDDEFVKFVNFWALQLSNLQDNPPLKRQDKKQVWQNISQQIFAKTPVQNPPIFALWFKYWHYQLSGVAVLMALLLFWQLPITTPNIKPLEWQISTDLAGKTVNISATTHQHKNANSACVLWVKHENMFHFIDKLPEVGEKQIALNAKLLALIQQGSMVHSTENISSFANSKIPKQPTKIDFIGSW